eukprot:scaffold174572_cov37-Attheya_sp.AAC.1
MGVGVCTDAGGYSFGRYVLNYVGQHVRDIICFAHNHFQNLPDVSEFSPDVGYDIGSVRYEIRSSQQTGNKPRTGRLAFMKNLTRTPLQLYLVPAGRLESRNEIDRVEV